MNSWLSSLSFLSSHSKTIAVHVALITFISIGFNSCKSTLSNSNDSASTLENLGSGSQIWSRHKDANMVNQTKAILKIEDECFQKSGIDVSVWTSKSSKARFETFAKLVNGTSIKRIETFDDDGLRPLSDIMKASKTKCGDQKWFTSSISIKAYARQFGEAKAGEMFTLALNGSNTYAFYYRDEDGGTGQMEIVLIGAQPAIN